MGCLNPRGQPSITECGLPRDPHGGARDPAGGQPDGERAWEGMSLWTLNWSLRALRSPVLSCIKVAVVLDGQDIDSKSYAFMKSEGAKPHFLLKRTRLEWGWMGWMSLDENVLPGKALTASALLPVPCLALVTQDYMMSHRLASAPETTDSLKMHPSSVQKQAAGETNGNGQSIFPQENFCLSHGGVRKGRLTSRRRSNHSRWKLVF